MKRNFLIIFFVVLISFFDTAYAKNTAVSKNIDRLEYVNISFWEHFNDNLLIENLLTVYKNNHDLKAAEAKVNEVKRLVKISLSNELPHIGFNGYAGQTFKSSDILFGDVVIPDYHETTFLLPLTYSYEFDIWGKNHLTTKAQKKNLDIIEQEEKTLYITLTSAFANIYYNLIKADKLIEYQKEIIDVQTAYLKAIKKQYEIGVAEILDVISAEKALTYQKEELQNLLEKQDLLQNQLSVMLADRAFEGVKRTDFENIKVNVKVPDEIDVNILDSRPDMVKAKLKLEKCGIDIKIAKRDLLPSFTLVGNIGFNFYNLSSAHTFLSDIGVVPNWDLFTGGRKTAILKLQKNRYDIAVEEYEKTILKSFQETNDSLFSLKSNNKKYAIANERLLFDEKELSLIKLKENAGMANDLDILARRERLLFSKKEQVSSKIDEIISLVQLYQAVGGVDFYNTSINL